MAAPVALHELHLILLGFPAPGVTRDLMVFYIIQKQRYHDVTSWALSRWKRRELFLILNVGGESIFFIMGKKGMLFVVFTSSRKVDYSASGRNAK